jgi:hypothetical protein
VGRSGCRNDDRIQLPRLDTIDGAVHRDTSRDKKRCGRLAAISRPILRQRPPERLSVGLGTAVITLGGHHALVLIMALVGFLILASGAVATNGFRSANKLGLTLIAAGCIVSVATLVGALSLLLFLMLAALLLGFLARMFLGR